MHKKINKFNTTDKFSAKMNRTSINLISTFDKLIQE